MKLQGTIVLVKPEIIDKTPGGIHLPPSKKKAPTGMVLDTGPGCTLVKVDDRIYYSPKVASVITIKGEARHFIRECDIAYIY